ncbi:DUF3596 domain-containing protein [Thermosynechococcaceae cyanobacterium BACA0444]|uniref:DUF3596 domain-containing protein n=1 Tax=Pseudocalidococcus azoricus BACA0444 TaxID=2918990 RepID=A0AAE4FRN0_9CYAN|nr:DUF3596 domain-containing protein [Pseudocalidococcus azoricus]MDS3860881.1 DUF3596 domain-containing protein [Pseudocalidococcus azoricus BACA0444]
MGKVSIIQNKGNSTIPRLMVSFSHKGERHRLSLGLPDNPVNRTYAEMLCRDIELKILSRNLEAWLDDSNFIYFYGAHLSAVYSRRFNDYLNLSDEFKKAIENLLNEVNSLVRWPEIVTFEELNSPNPWQDEKTIKSCSFWSFLIENPGMAFFTET